MKTIKQTKLNYSGIHCKLDLLETPNLNKYIWSESAVMCEMRFTKERVLMYLCHSAQIQMCALCICFECLTVIASYKSHWNISCNAIQMIKKHDLRNYSKLDINLWAGVMAGINQQIDWITSACVLPDRLKSLRPIWWYSLTNSNTPVCIVK